MLSPGTRLGPYEVVAPLGAGGMGEVFRARDARLARDVAIKALPAAFAQDPERLARFEREARLLASLSHPNIAGIHGLEEVGGSRYLVLEFVDGQTLQTHLDRGAMPLGEAVDVARQIAAGVEAAHEAGVVHRDLKPGNVMLTATGGVKVLDFGLAKSGTGRGSDSNPNLSASPTLAYQGTEAGVILGTAAYMSPEQARGKAVDRRTDIWSFGCVLFEMLAGRRVYDGETVSDMVARILEREPDWSALPAVTPPRLIALLKRCLTKDAKQRQRDIGDVRLELDAIAAGDHGEAPADARRPATRRAAPAWLLAAGAAGLLVLGAVAMGMLAPRGTNDEPATLTLLSPPGVSFGREPTDLAISPDGRQLVFTAVDTTSGARLWVRGLERENARPLEGTENAEYPFWAPDNRRVGFFASGKLKTVNVTTGSVRTLADAPLPRGGTWGRGTILYQPRSLGPLWRISDEGGEPAIATVVDSAAGDLGQRFPQFLPDGRHFVAIILGKGDNRVAAGTLGDSKLKPLFPTSGSSGASFAAPHWLIGARGGAAKAQRFDPRALQTSGPAIEVPGLRAMSPNANGSPIISASQTGVLLQRAGLDLPQRLVLVDRQGRTVSEIATPEGTFARGAISPDGRRAVLEYESHSGADIHVWVADLVRGGMQPWTFEDQNFTPVFSPDGREIALARATASATSQDLWLMRADLPGSARLVRRMENAFQSVLGFSPDGRGVLLRTQGTHTQQDLIFVSWGDSVRSRTVLGTRFNEPVGAISPDGRWLAYVSNESGQYECRVRSFEDSEGQVTVVSHGAYATSTSSSRIGLPVWRRDGRELLYVAADRLTLMTVDVTPGDPPAFGEPRPLFRLPTAVADIAVSPGLDRILLSIIREEEGRSAATVLLNWQKLLESAR